MLDYKSWLKIKESTECQGMFGPVYHGTQKDFDSFDPKHSNFHGTIYFTDNPHFAHKFATGEGFAGEETNGHIFKACLNVKKPFQPDNEEHLQTLIPIIKQKVEEKYKDPATDANFNIPNTLNNPKTNQPIQNTDDAVEHILWRIKHKSWRFIESKPIIDFIKKQGFDSILTTELGAKNIAVFDPKLIHILDKSKAEIKHLQ